MSPIRPIVIKSDSIGKSVTTSTLLRLVMGGAIVVDMRTELPRKEFVVTQSVALDSIRVPLRQKLTAEDRRNRNRPWYDQFEKRRRSRKR